LVLLEANSKALRLMRRGFPHRALSGDWIPFSAPCTRGTAVQVFFKRSNRLIAEHREYGPKYWTTSFAFDSGVVLDYIGNRKIGIFEMKNHNEEITVGKWNDKVVIYYGKE
jgi:hypothetical protein